jgi:hypothetical protein
MIPNFETTATWSVVLSSFQVAEVDFSFALAEAEPDAARAEPAALAQLLAWLPAWVEEERACFEVEVPAVGVAAVLVADELVAGLAVGAEALVPACSALAEALAADELVAGLVAGAAQAVLVADGVEAPAADELVVALVAGARAPLPVWLQADWRALDCDWAAAELGPELAAHRAVRWAVDRDSVEHFAGPQRADGRR